MKDLNFEDELNFNEFPPVSTQEWEEIIKKDLKGKDYKKTLLWETGEGIEPLPFYRGEDLNKLKHQAKPLTTSGNWSILEVVESPDPATANKHALQALENGASGLDLRMNADQISAIEDLKVLFKDIQLDIITIVFGADLSSPEINELMHQLGKDRGMNLNDLDIHFTADLFSNAVMTGRLPKREAFDTYLNAMTSGTFAIDSSVYANAGADIVQQLAFALAAGNEYLGTDPDLANNLSFRFSAGSSYFPEIAKFRAFKLVWEQVLSEYDKASITADMLAETAAWNKTVSDAHNNMLRATTEAMSAAIGGCTAISIRRFDDSFNEPENFASRIARNTQLILQEEAHINKVSDPGAGSYYIEVLTEKIAEKSWKLFQQIEKKGGFYDTLRSGYIQELINGSRANKIKAYREKQKTLIGVNKFQPDETANAPLQNSKNNFSPVLNDADTFEIPTIEILNLEAELEKGDA